MSQGGRSPAWPVHQLPTAAQPSLEGSGKPADDCQLETGDRHLHIHLHSADPAEVAWLIRRIDRSNP